MERRLKIDLYYRQNVIGISGVEFLWGLGLPVVIESTFLQLFLKHLGASNFAVGLIPFFLFTGSSVFALLSSYMTSGMRFKRRAVIILHLVSGTSLMIFGCLLYIIGEASYILLLFFSCYSIFCVCIGMTLPVWLNYLVIIFSENKSVSGLAIMMIAQNIAKLIGSFLILKVVDQYEFASPSSAVIFISVGTLLTLGSLFFLFTRELPLAEESIVSSNRSFFEYLKQPVRHILKDKNFLYFLGADFEFFIVISIVSFYANYATTFRGVEPALAAGAFVGCIYCGAIVSNIALGTMGLLSLKNKYILSKLVAILALAIIILIDSDWGFYIASVLFGLSRGTRMLVYAPAIKKLSGQSDATGYFAVCPLFSLPLATLLPMTIGKFIDHYGWLGADAYHIVFVAAAVLLIFTLVCIIKTDFSAASPIAS